jgi:hypothetical protein
MSGESALIGVDLLEYRGGEALFLYCGGTSYRLLLQRLLRQELLSIAAAGILQCTQPNVIPQIKSGAGSTV